MMRSLWWRLLSAFALVILLSAIVNAIVMSVATRGQFYQFVAQSGQTWTQRLAPALAAYYADTGSWQGVERLLQSQTETPMGFHRGPPWRGGERWGPDGQGGWDRWGNMEDRPPWTWMGIQLMLADAQGVVVADSTGLNIGQQLGLDRLANGTPIEVDGEWVGTLIAVTALGDEASPAGGYLRTLYHSIWLSSMVAGGLALILGVILFRQIVAPIRAVTAAAQRIATGSLEQRVPVTSRDEVGQLAHTFNQMADALVHDQRVRQHMIADIAHELRTPLSVVQANLEAMLDGVVPANSQEIASLHDEVMLLSRLVADLRLLSLAEAGQLKLERMPVDPAGLVHRVVDRMNVQAEAQQITLTAEVAPSLPPIDVDADRIGQVLTNLVSNALRYTPVQGRVEVRAATDIGDSTQPMVQFSVADTGSGIAPEELPHLFDRFYRPDKSRSRASGGSGLGLAIVKLLVEAHDGRVWVESQPQQGATFFFAIPVAAALA